MMYLQKWLKNMVHVNALIVACNLVGCGASEEDDLECTTADCGDDKPGVSLVGSPLDDSVESAAGCPPAWELALSNHEPCSLDRGAICAFRVPGSGFTASICGCLENGRWDSFSVIGGPNCPDTRPVVGAACDPLDGATCPYFPDQACRCDRDTNLWTCETRDAIPAQCLSAPEPQTQPSGIAPEAVIADLDDETARAWCEWYTEVFPIPGTSGTFDPSADIVEGGSTIGLADVCVQNLEVDACLANLNIGTCSAKLVELEDCVRTVFESSAVGASCAAIRATPGCATTIAQTSGEYSSLCPVPLR